MADRLPVWAMMCQVPAPVVCPPEYEWEFPSAFSFVLREVEDGFPTAWVPASVAMDVAGNMNDAAEVAWSGVEFDTTSPNATLATSLAGKTFGGAQLTVTSACIPTCGPASPVLAWRVGLWR